VKHTSSAFLLLESISGLDVGGGASSLEALEGVCLELRGGADTRNVRATEKT